MTHHQQEAHQKPKAMSSKTTVVVALMMLLLAAATSEAGAWKASCADPYYGKCYGIPHRCPPGCPTMCQVDCKLCKPICECDKPGAVCQDPRFIGGDGITFYFHGKKDRDFCLFTDSQLHINAHFIGKSSPMRGRRDFTWVQALAILLPDGRRLYVGAQRLARWDPQQHHMTIRLDDNDLDLPAGHGGAWQSTGLAFRRLEPFNAVRIDGEAFSVSARVVPVTQKESRVHGYGMDAQDCLAHLEVRFSFYHITPHVSGVLGQTYAPGYRSPVNIGAAMPVLGGHDRFSVSHLFATDCTVCRFRRGVS